MVVRAGVPCSQVSLCLIVEISLLSEEIAVSEQRTPVDILREILRQFGTDSPQLSFFVQLHGFLNACVMALIIVSSGDATDACLKASISEVLILYL